ncbi:MAG: SDR family oxidoreductase [Chitinophagaceae bacterium]|jgi:short-subunit dehydrogenase|nr:SDR family oxidoreductase [Chitinophagaceae bacterium]
MESVKNKNVLIVGATGGIGSRVAKLLAGSGANLFLAGRNSEKLAALAQEINLSASKTLALDISKPNEVAVLKEQFFAQYPAIDVLVNAAGLGIIKSSDTLTEDEFMQTIHTNLYAPFLLVKAFLPNMKETKKGLIINIPGILGKVPMLGAAAYSASKYGLNGMMQSIREEVKRTEIRITNLFLGGVDTPFWDGIDLRVQRDKMVVAEEAAKAIWFLCQQPTSAVVSEMVVQPFNHQAI